MKHSKKMLVLLAGVLAVVCAHDAGAVPGVPTSAQPGIVTRSLEKSDRAPSRIEDTIVIPEDVEQKASGDTNKVFTLKGVVLEGSDAYQTEDFKNVYEKFIGEKVSFADLNGIAAGMTRKYRQDGYVFSRVILPPQKVEDGILHVRAVEGRVTNVEVTGNYSDSNGLVKEFADKIRSAGPANTKEIERYLLLIDDLPGITARSFMKPSKTPGGGDLIIDVQEDLFEGSASVENRGSRYIGPWRGELVGAFNSLMGMHDRTTLRALLTSQTEELRYGEITHEQQIGSEGMRLKGRVALTGTQPGGSISALDISGVSRLFDLEAMYPLYRGRQINLNLLSGFTVNNTQTDLSNIQIAEDRVRTGRVGAHIDFTDPLRGVNQIDGTLTQGFDALGATKDGTGRSRANGEHQFLRFNGTVTRLQDLMIPNVTLFLSGTLQASPEPLLASEEFTIGGGSFGRAYDAGELAGDRGYAGVAELRYAGEVSSDLLQSYELYTFIDYGKVKNSRPVAGEVAEDSASSAGLGTRFNMAHDMSGYVEFDSPLNKVVSAEGDDDSRLFFNILKRF